jgi:uncharacterized protein with PQ loop repeat
MDTLVALAANALICVILLPQLIRLFKKKKARYLSTWLLVLIMPTALSWGVFGWLEHQNMVVASSATHIHKLGPPTTGFKQTQTRPVTTWPACQRTCILIILPSVSGAVFPALLIHVVLP